jgi:hypothetical protein
MPHGCLDLGWLEARGSRRYDAMNAHPTTLRGLLKAEGLGNLLPSTAEWNAEGVGADGGCSCGTTLSVLREWADTQPLVLRRWLAHQLGVTKLGPRERIIQALRRLPCRLHHPVAQPEPEPEPEPGPATSTSTTGVFIPPAGTPTELPPIGPAGLLAGGGWSLSEALGPGGSAQYLRCYHPAAGVCVMVGRRSQSIWYGGAAGTRGPGAGCVTISPNSAPVVNSINGPKTLSTTHTTPRSSALPANPCVGGFAAVVATTVWRSGVRVHVGTGECVEDTMPPLRSPQHQAVADSGGRAAATPGHQITARKPLGVGCFRWVDSRELVVTDGGRSGEMAVVGISSSSLTPATFPPRSGCPAAPPACSGRVRLPKSWSARQRASHQSRHENAHTTAGAVTPTMAGEEERRMRQQPLGTDVAWLWLCADGSLCLRPAAASGSPLRCLHLPPPSSDNVAELALMLVRACPAQLVMHERGLRLFLTRPNVAAGPSPARTCPTRPGRAKPFRTRLPAAYPSPSQRRTGSR